MCSSKRVILHLHPKLRSIRRKSQVRELSRPLFEGPPHQPLSTFEVSVSKLLLELPTWVVYFPWESSRLLPSVSVLILFDVVFHPLLCSFVVFYMCPLSLGICLLHHVSCHTSPFWSLVLKVLLCSITESQKVNTRCLEDSRTIFISTTPEWKLT